MSTQNQKTSKQNKQKNTKQADKKLVLSQSQNTLQQQPSSKQLLSSKRKSAAVRKIKGKGDYNIKDMYNSVFENDQTSEGFVNKGARKVGEALGGAIGFGRELGNAASKLARIFGFGDYEIVPPGQKGRKVITHKYPIRTNSYVNNTPPTFSAASGEDVIITRREMFAKIPVSSPFTARKYFLNPGNPEVFPWLSQFAKSYEEYQFKGLVFEFESTASDSAADGGGVASVMFATDYDCLDENYEDSITMMSSEFANSCKISQSTLHPVECDPKRNVLSRMFVLPGISSVSQIVGTNGISVDPRFDTLGQTYVAIQGGEDSSVGSIAGNLWVSYKVRLSRPIMELGTTNVGSISVYQKYVSTTNADIVMVNGKKLTVKSQGAQAFVPDVQSDGYLNLLYKHQSPGYFIIHIAGRIPYGATSTWYANISATLGCSAAQWSYSDEYFFNATYGGLASNYRTQAYVDSSQGTSYKPWTAMHVGYYVPNYAPNALNNLIIPLPYNTSYNAAVQVTIWGIADFNGGLGRIRKTINAMVANNLENGTFETSDYLSKKLQSTSTSSSSKDIDDDTNNSSEPSTPYENLIDNIPTLTYVTTKDTVKHKSKPVVRS